MRFLRVILLLLGLCGSLACLADQGVYAYVDDQGVLHLSNVPDNERYQSLDKAGAAEVRERRVVRSAVDAAASGVANGIGIAGAQRRFGGVVAQVADQFGIDAALLHAVISVESGYNARAVSRRGAAGLMQLMPETARQYGVTDVFDPADNVRGGAQYLTYLLRLFDNNLQLALAAYNAGEGAVMKYGKRIPPYRETVAYVPKVVDSYEKFKLSM